ncbi:Aliphatic sulfonates import ATP-binding protein SsuB [Massilia sp. Bi118]|uniref:ABC transporter ATP-binding protein n=1 Tax=Massilia sp. Bi118 TaxID=2822346 RepID=UPI001DF9AFB8|nr:ABC transporter ATP-binding protein [Massilia sp. Bi118]CAH0300072.1 Aliphatic sulfonates import ATP-binding protein SsuB [Massilia sp. Bi118]
MDAKIVIDDIKKGFTRKGETLQVIAGLSLNVKDGEFVAIVGPSGCGKSTLMKMISGFALPDSGAVRIDGVEVRGPGPQGIVISQHGSVFPWLTVRENLMFGLNRGTPAEKRALADHYAEMVGLKGFENAYPRELSGGMLKRVEIARALVVKPQILYMDEPFSALDALMNLRIRNELLRILQEERHTVILITHDVEEALYLADRIVVLSQRPTTIQRTFQVTQPHPRRLSNAQLQQMKDEILSELGLDLDLDASADVVEQRQA